MVVGEGCLEETKSLFPFETKVKPENFCSMKMGYNFIVPSHKGPVPLRSEQWGLKTLQTFGGRDDWLSVNWQMFQWGFLFVGRYIVDAHVDQSLC